MNSFVRLFGGALGALIAIVLAGGADVPSLDLGSIGAVVLLVLWVAAWVASVSRSCRTSPSCPRAGSSAAS